ncbi:MAG: hypothetical protein GX085_09975 [Firmicutes bacterium]|nr:hypothetical protein [Bacillota bacterium]
MRKEKYLFYYLLLVLLMSAGAAVWHIFLPNLAESFSVWGVNRGWQTEISLWNIGLIAGIVITLLSRNVEYAKILSIISVSLCILLGIHHLVYALTATNGNTGLHWLGAVEVLLLGSAAGIIAIIKSRCFKEQKP